MIMSLGGGGGGGVKTIISPSLAPVLIANKVRIQNSLHFISGGGGTFNTEHHSHNVKR